MLSDMEQNLSTLENLKDSWAKPDGFAPIMIAFWVLKAMTGGE